MQAQLAQIQNMATVSPTGSSVSPSNPGLDELGASQSSPVLPESATSGRQDLSLLLGNVVRPKSLRDSVGAADVTSSLKDLEDLEELEARKEEMKRVSSFTDFLEDRDDQAWLVMQVRSSLARTEEGSGHLSTVNSYR
jgi:hypothetical protein